MNRVQLLKQMLLKEPHDPFLNYALALENAKDNKIEEAIELLEGILERDENYLGAYYQLGKLYQQVGKTEMAIKVFNKGVIVARKKNDLKTHGELSEALMLLEDEL